MTKVDFYILEANQQQAWLFTCRLIEKMYTTAQKIFIYTNSRLEAEQIDTLLWTYRDDSFIPHSLYQAHTDNPPLIQIGYPDWVATGCEVIINLQDKMADFFRDCPHLIEIVFSEPTVQQLARDRYKQYRDQGFHLNTHKLTAHD